ncbi:hypothetical protein [Candidatus Solincola tengchongensis]|uniref:hypothetical protein n=1 Tax=Candidatus Solincola tengchongensis TaxID=2900693 RepID=UPI00257DC3CA|nr:hypothetical protein [Candidatus Solincola tengchongensis]
MLEIIVLILVCGRVFKIAKYKGYRGGLAVLATIGVWLACEVLGAIIGAVAFRNQMGAVVFAFIAGMGGLLLTYLTVKKMGPKVMTLGYQSAPVDGAEGTGVVNSTPANPGDLQSG